MKPFNINFFALILFAGLLFSGCDKDNPPADENEELNNEITNTVFDSLMGEWHWKYTYDPKKGIIDNDFKSVVHFLSVNDDTTISYETYKSDSLRKSGKLKIVTTDWGRKIEPDLLLNFNVANENYFEFIADDTLRFYEFVNDGYDFYYIKQMD